MDIKGTLYSSLKTKLKIPFKVSIENVNVVMARMIMMMTAMIIESL